VRLWGETQVDTYEIVADVCRGVLDQAWRNEPGFASPNPRRYPWQWLWDSCFHAIAWSAMRDVRALTEMESLFSGQLASGFMPNMLYHGKPRANFWLWRVSGHSTITQPPMYGHALKVLSERGYDVEHLLTPATRAMHHLIDSRRDASTGLVKVVHPWETGCDDSPRWSRWMRFGYHRKLWNIKKFRLVRSLTVHGGEGIGNRKFEVCPASFNALVAFNALELADLTHDQLLREKAQDIVRCLELTWQPAVRTWADVLPGSGAVSSAVPTLESLLPLLVVRNSARARAAWENLFDPETFLRPWGFAGVAVNDPHYKSDGYWFGGCWPQLCYLLSLAAARGLHCDTERAEQVRRLSVKGIISSGLSEYWDPEDGRGLGASPQSWSAILIELLRDCD